MTVAELAQAIAGSVVGAPEAAGNQVGGAYASDLLSDVMANAEDGDVWITLQKHVNIVAVAQLKNLSAIVLIGGRQPNDDTLARAAEHRIPVVTTTYSAFDVAGLLYQLGVRGRRAS